MSLKISSSGRESKAKYECKSAHYHFWLLPPANVIFLNDTASSSSFMRLSTLPLVFSLTHSNIWWHGIDKQWVVKHGKHTMCFLLNQWRMTMRAMMMAGKVEFFFVNSRIVFTKKWVVLVSVMLFSIEFLFVILIHWQYNILYLFV